MLNNMSSQSCCHHVLVSVNPLFLSMMFAVCLQARAFESQEGVILVEARLNAFIRDLASAAVLQTAIHVAYTELYTFQKL